MPDLPNRRARRAWLSWRDHRSQVIAQRSRDRMAWRSIGEIGDLMESQPSFTDLLAARLTQFPSDRRFYAASTPRSDGGSWFRDRFGFVVNTGPSPVSALRE